MTPDGAWRIAATLTTAEEADARRGCVETMTAFPTLVGQVFGNPTVPTAIGQYYSVHPVDILGMEAEGGEGVLAPDASRTYLADVIGPAPAVAGDFLICRFVGHRWVANRESKSHSSGGITIPGCPCSESPALIHMTSSSPQSNNRIFQSAALQYGPTPASLLRVVFTTNSYLSTASFLDPLLNVPFYYFLTCSSEAYVLTRVYVTSPFGSPFRDTIRYNWVPGFPGNSCTPFLMSNGQIFPGGDATCVVTLSE